MLPIAVAPGRVVLAALLLAALYPEASGCGGAGDSPESAGDVEGGSDVPGDGTSVVVDGGSVDVDAALGDIADGGGPPLMVHVLATLDGEPVAGAIVHQGGARGRWVTDERGSAAVVLDLDVPGAWVILANHPEARTAAALVDLAALDAPVAVALVRFDPTDNSAYSFWDVGEPSLGTADEGKCRHCHRALVDGWWESSHRRAASNPRFRDLYAGAAAALDPEACAQRGGAWGPLHRAGAGSPDVGCRIGDGVLPTLNPACEGDPSCVAVQRGACADCHAPAIDGELGGRDVREAGEDAAKYGVHCQTCHLTESIAREAPAGVAGRLHIVRPSEKIDHVVLGTWRPLHFGPHDDVAAPAMGAVPRAHFADGSLCAGCHELEQASLWADAPVDRARWPTGVFPVHSTVSEWERGPFGFAAECATCHMAPMPEVGNGAALTWERVDESGVAEGWLRFPGAVSSHRMLGALDDGAFLLGQALHLDVRGSWERGQWVVRTSVRNVGAGHAVPTGEPLRALVVVVDASCGESAEPPIGGPAVPDFGGYARRGSVADAAGWTDVEPGERMRVVRTLPAYYDYDGVPPFDVSGRFSPQERGMPVEEWVGEAIVVKVEGGTLETAPPLEDLANAGGDAAYLIRGDGEGQWAGAAGMAFARVLRGPDGERMVPHFLAVDVVSDNRLEPGAQWVMEHRFAPGCEAPSVRARAMYRAMPWGLARQRGWEVPDTAVVEVRR